MVEKILDLLAKFALLLLIPLGTIAFVIVPYLWEKRKTKRHARLAKG